MRYTNKTESSVNIFLVKRIMWHCKENSILSLFQYHCSSSLPNSLIPLLIFHSNTSHNIYLKGQSHARNPLFRHAGAVHGPTHALWHQCFTFHVFFLPSICQRTQVCPNPSGYLANELTCYYFDVVTVSPYSCISFWFWSFSLIFILWKCSLD